MSTESAGLAWRGSRTFSPRIFSFTGQTLGSQLREAIFYRPTLAVEISKDEMTVCPSPYGVASALLDVD